MNKSDQDSNITSNPGEVISPSKPGDKPQDNNPAVEKRPHPTEWLVESARRLSRDPKRLAEVERLLF